LGRPIRTRKNAKKIGGTEAKRKTWKDKPSKEGGERLGRSGLQKKKRTI